MSLNHVEDVFLANYVENHSYISFSQLSIWDPIHSAKIHTSRRGLQMIAAVLVTRARRN